MIFFCLISKASWGLSKGGKCSICNWCLCFWILSTSTDFQLIYSRKIVQINLTRNFQILFAYSQFVFVMKKLHTLHECKVDIFWQIFHKILRPLHLLYRLSWTLHLQTFTFNHNSEFHEFWLENPTIPLHFVKCANMPLNCICIVCLKKKTKQKDSCKIKEI